jgi:hypothetical protein
MAMKVNCDLQLTLMASSRYRLLAVRIGNGYEAAESRHVFRDFIDATADIEITERSWSGIKGALTTHCWSPLAMGEPRPSFPGWVGSG